MARIWKSFPWGRASPSTTCSLHDEKAEADSRLFAQPRWFSRAFRNASAFSANVERPTFDDLVNHQIDELVKAKGHGKLEDLFASDDTWTVEAK